MRWWLKPSARTISLSKEGPLGPDSALPPVSNLSSTKPSLPLAVSHSCLYCGNWKSDAIGSSHDGEMGQVGNQGLSWKLCLIAWSRPALRLLDGWVTCNLDMVS
ncbi:hypothetical protein Pyn_20872 [Prunus yedoensis var. nudiflora]|uniref:Uncharacterized protein n=1 Tax=Prunus yedoensis var. nudiflora TaxID=2094558 RepID=A0A314XYD8_PRUYE|nr:hypothetical protein Pyn_20872 [Prunus yedoensis var. nudiflora]